MKTRFTDWLLIREQERPAVGYFVLLSLLLGTGLAIGRASSDALFFKRYGVEYLPQIYVALAGLLAVTSTTYAAFADRIAAERLATQLLIALAAALALSWWLMAHTAFTMAYPVYYLLFQVASEILVMHTSLYLSQNFDTQQGKRLFPVVFAALEAGRILGGLLLAATARLLGMVNVSLVWLALVALVVTLILRHHHRIGPSPFYRPSPRRHAPLRRALEQITQGTRFARGSPLVRAQAGALFFLVVSFYILSYATNRVYTEHFHSEEALGAFLGGLSAFTALAALLIQMFVTSRLIERFGLKAVNLLFPVTHLMAHALLLAHFALPAALFASFNRDSLMPAVRNPARNLLLNVLPDTLQGRVRALSIGLVLPVALATGGLGLIWLQRTGSTTTMMLVGFLAASLFLYYNARSNRAYHGTILATLRERLFLPGQQLDSVLTGAGRELAAELRRGLDSEDENVCLAHARLLAQRLPEEAPAAIAARLARSAPPLRDQLLGLVDNAHLPAVREQLWPTLRDADPHYRATLLTALLSARDTQAAEEVDALLASPHPRLLATGIHGVLSLGLESQRPEAIARWRKMLSGNEEFPAIEGLRVLALHPRAEMADDLWRALAHPLPGVQHAALTVLARWPHPLPIYIDDRLLQLLNSTDPKIRAAALGAAHLLAPDMREAHLYAALDHPHVSVQQAAKVAWHKYPQPETALGARLNNHAGAPRAQVAALKLLLECGASPDTFEGIAHSKLDDLRQLIAMRKSADHQPSGNALALLRIVLDERRAQTIELVLLALEGLEDRAAVSIIRAGLASNDRRQRANALEALAGLRHRQLGARLAALLQEEDGATGPAVAEMLAWCTSRNDPWLSTCARNAAGAAG